MLVHNKENAMTNDILIVIRSGPYGSFQAAEGLRHSNGAISMKFRPTVLLIDDGVYLAQTDQNPGQSPWFSMEDTLNQIIARGLYENKEAPAEFYVEKESLTARGLNPEDLVEELELVDHQKVSELMAVNHLKLIF
jgi:sulfur relay (sulfurtransferase) DsrF/TusC family protein